jgi:hypothetical protein
MGGHKEFPGDFRGMMPGAPHRLTLKRLPARGRQIGPGHGRGGATGRQIQREPEAKNQPHPGSEPVEKKIEHFRSQLSKQDSSRIVKKARAKHNAGENKFAFIRWNSYLDASHLGMRD